MISAVSTMLLKGLQGATSRANYREEDINSEQTHTHILEHTLCISSNTVAVCSLMTWSPAVLAGYWVKESLLIAKYVFVLEKQQYNSDWTVLTLRSEKLQASNTSHLLCFEFLKLTTAETNVPQSKFLRFIGVVTVIFVSPILTPPLMQHAKFFLPAHNSLCHTSVWFSLRWLLDSMFKSTLQHLQRIWPILCIDGSSQWWSLWIFLFPEEDWDMMWVTDRSQIENINKAGDSLVTRLIKCVAFWEMRYWAASMASRTARTLFCRA